MPKRYFLSVAVFGLSVIAGLLIYFIPESLVSIFRDIDSITAFFRMFTATIMAIITTILAGMYIDKKETKFQLFKTIFAFPFLICLSGITVGSFINFLVATANQRVDFYSFFCKPFMVGIYGTPGVLFVGVVSYLGFFALQKIKTPASAQ